MSLTTVRRRHDLARLRAILIVVGLFVLFIAVHVVPITGTPASVGSGATSRGDDVLFDAVVGRVHGGESYYSAMGNELRQRNYPTASVFNWRTPLLYLAMGSAPQWVSLTALAAFGALFLGSSMLYLSRHAPPEGVVLALLAEVAALVTMAAPTNRLFTEVWAGLAIALSAVSYARAAWVPAALLGLAGLFVRELAAPYCLVCFVLAARARRTRELIVWFVGALLYAAYYAVHVAQVWAQHRPEDLAHPASWVQWGGLPFLLATLQSNGALQIAPRVVMATMTVLLAAALWAPTIPAHVRGAILSYSLLFAVVGRPFNDYWGFVPGLTYAFALAYGLSGIGALIRSSRLRVEHAPSIDTVEDRGPTPGDRDASRRSP